MSQSNYIPVRYRMIRVENLNVFYREAGADDAPTIVLLHGFPSSSHMFRDLIPALAREYHVIAPDYPGFGHSDSPPVNQFTYTFDHLANVVEKLLETLGLERVTLYLQDYGAPIGFRIATRHPEWVQALIIQNGNAYQEGLGPEVDRLAPFWAERTPETENLALALLTREATIFQYTHGVRDASALSPDAWTFDQALLDRPGNDAIQLELLHNYRNNPPRYPEWQNYLRQHQPPTLIVWGQNDPIFTVAGARAYLRDVPGAELHLIDSGHFALEDSVGTIAPLITRFMSNHVGREARAFVATQTV